MNECKICKTPSLSCFYKQNNCTSYVARPRVYLQFNELVFNGVSSVDTASLTGDYKMSTEPYPFRHGVYTGGVFKGGQLLMDAQDLSLDLKLPFINLTRLQALDYNTFIQYNLSKSGRLWAMDTGGKLIWANAIPKHPAYSEYTLKSDKTLSLSCDFLLPEGVWHVADTSEIFLIPYNQCDFNNGLIRHNCNQPLEKLDKSCEECESVICEDMHYCNTCWNPYDPCNSEYQIVQHSGLAKKWFKHETWGLVFTQSEDCLAGFYKSNTIFDAPTQVILVGRYLDPFVEINNTRIEVAGSFDGTLIFNKNGSVSYLESERTVILDKAPLSIHWDNISYPSGSIRLESKHGKNSFRVFNRLDKQEWNRAYVKVDELVG